MTLHRKGLKGMFVLAVVTLGLTGGLALAADQTIGDIATSITSSFESIGKLMIAVAYVSGLGFAVAAIFKFKQHKDNPTQIPIGTPIALLAIAIALVFLPAFFKPLGKTLGVDSSSAGGFTGSGVSQLPQ